MTVTTGASTARPASEDCMTLEQRMVRIDTLLCILFSGFTNHPMAKAMISEEELAQLRAILPKD